MQAPEIEACLEELNDELRLRDVRGELCLYGGAVMCLVFKARPATKDVDAVFEPSAIIREAAKTVGRRRGIADDWINDAVKGFIVDHPRRPWREMSHLHVYVPDAEYMLATKCMAARLDTSDADDVRFLVQRIGLHRPEEVFAVLQQYYPDAQIKPATKFFVEEMLNP